MDNFIIVVRWISTLCCLLLSLFILFTFFKPIKAWLKKSIKIIPSKNRSSKIYFLLCALLFLAVSIFNFILMDLYIIVGCAFIMCTVILVLRALLPNGIYEEGIITDFKHYKWDDIDELDWEENKLSLIDKKGSTEALVFDSSKKEEAFDMTVKKGDLPEKAEDDSTPDFLDDDNINDLNNNSTDNNLDE